MKKVLSFLKKNLVFVFLVVVLGILGYGFNLINKTRQELKKIEEEIKAKHEEIKKYKTQKELAPSPELVNRLEKQYTAIATQFNSLLNRFSTTYPEVPEFKVFPNVEFKEFLFETNDLLTKKARKNNVIIPSSFGFQETGFPSKDQIPLFSLQITIIKHILDLLIDSGVSVVNSVVPGIPSTVAFYKILPLDVSITGTSVEIMRFLRYLNNPSSFFTVESFAITRKGSGLFQGNFKINAVMIEKAATISETVSVAKATGSGQQPQSSGQTPVQVQSPPAR
ncbi:MAG: Amuc_1100 family pilus-like protein [Candidatus Omnitrophica bacterium]|nr:Amuc_1100 family pilus-like protein [Candidatus Omnitrophota bacterium]MCM8816996.1 Amuc_1100 family pilus-like protein [Candidatus Omnitrophota bacterium]